MNKWEIGGIVAAIIAIVTATAYVSDIKSDVKAIQSSINDFDKKALQKWKKNIEDKVREADSLPIGTLVPTTLEPHDFKSIVGDSGGSDWVPADGRLAKDSEYYKITGNPRVPDMRAMFLRGLNKFDEFTGTRSDKFKDTGKREDIFGYSFQNYSTAKPNIPFIITENGKHEHGPGNLNGSTTSNGNHNHSYQEHAFGHDLNDRGEPNKSEDNDGLELTRKTGNNGNHNHSVSISSGTTGESGTHSHEIKKGGDSETRPNNIGVYYMIRIN